MTSVRLDGSCFRRLIDIDAAEYAQMPIGLLRDAVNGMRRALDGPPHPMEFSTTNTMVECELLTELFERLPHLPETCMEKMDVGLEFDPSSIPKTFLHPTVLDEVIRAAAMIHDLPDTAIELIIAHAKQTLPGIMIFGSNDHDGPPRRGGSGNRIVRGLPHYPLRFARPASMAADGACTIEELEHVPIGPDVLEPDGTRHNAFVPVNALVEEPTTTRIRFEPNNDAFYGPGMWISASSDGGPAWSMWNGVPAKAWVVR